MFKRQSVGDIIFEIIIYIVICCIILIIAYPLIFVISASLSNPEFVMQGRVRLLPQGFTIQAYHRVFENERIWNGYINTIKYTLVGTSVNMVMTIFGAYPLSRKDFVGRKFFIMVFIFTMFFSGGMLPKYLLIQKLGLLNNFWVMIIPEAVVTWNLILMKTFFQSIPSEIQEAALIDGCTNFGILFKIILPLSAPILAVIGLFYAVGHWNAYFNALIYLSDQSMYPLQLVVREILNQEHMNEMLLDIESIREQQLLAETLKYAVIIISSIPMLVIYPFVQGFFKKGIMLGAIKG